MAPARRAVIGVLRCAVCRQTHLSVWPSDVVGEAMQCVFCGCQAPFQQGPGHVLSRSSAIHLSESLIWSLDDERFRLTRH